MSAVTQTGQAAPGSVPAGGLIGRRGLADRSFQWLALGAGLLVLVILVLIAITTTQQASSWFSTEGIKIFSSTWDTAKGQFGALSFIYGTAVTGVIALAIAVPVSISDVRDVTEQRQALWAAQPGTGRPNSDVPWLAPRRRMARRLPVRSGLKGELLSTFNL